MAGSSFFIKNYLSTTSTGNGNRGFHYLRNMVRYRYYIHTYAVYDAVRTQDNRHGYPVGAATDRESQQSLPVGEKASGY